MLGRFSNGMTVKIPATFQDGNKNLVEMDNVNVGIQFFDNDHREFKQILAETPMQILSTGKYVYEFRVPDFASPGNYIVNIKGKYPGSISNISEAADTFQVIENRSVIVKKEDTVQTPQPQPEEYKKPDFDINTFKIDQVKNINQNTRVDIEDTVVDVFNNPVKGVHVNIFQKNGFVPKSPNNVKISSTVTDEAGTWRMKVSPGEYVFTYKGIGMREMREFRKV